MQAIQIKRLPGEESEDFKLSKLILVPDLLKPFQLGCTMAKRFFTNARFVIKYSQLGRSRAGIDYEKQMLYFLRHTNPPLIASDADRYWKPAQVGAGQGEARFGQEPLLLRPQIQEC